MSAAESLNYPPLAPYFGKKSKTPKSFVSEEREIILRVYTSAVSMTSMKTQLAAEEEVAVVAVLTEEAVPAGDIIDHQMTASPRRNREKLGLRERSPQTLLTSFVGLVT
jgi:hypothetical protein